jgi:hypothetical protein
MNGDNLGRIEGENRDLGSNKEDFSNDLDINKNPDIGDHAQEDKESGEEREINPPQEKGVMDSETDGSLEGRREKRKKTYKRIVNVIVLGSMLTQSGGSARAVTNGQKEREKEDNITPVSEQYHEDITSESTEDKQEFTFLNPSIGSGLDSEGLVVEEESEIVEEKDEEVVEEDVFAELEESLSPEVKEILSIQPELSFDENGKLYYEEGESTNPVLTVETDRHLYFPYEQLSDVKFFVIHFDGAPQTLASGEYRTVLNTVNGLNRSGKPSVQFCVDSYPVSDEFVDKNGVGVILSQATGPMPYKGRNVIIGYDLATGREDLNRVKTADLYEEVGVGKDFVDFIRAGYKDFESFSLALEQVGTNFSYDFPEQFPPNQQIANVLALVEAASERYGLSVWDIVGHHEIQEKGDPGDEYMLTLRYLLGLSYLLDEQLPDDFLETDDPYDYFTKLKDYSIARMGEDRYSDWDDIYGLDGVIEWFENIAE